MLIYILLSTKRIDVSLALSILHKVKNHIHLVQEIICLV